MLLIIFYFAVFCLFLPVLTSLLFKDFFMLICFDSIFGVSISVLFEVTLAIAENVL